MLSSKKKMKCASKITNEEKGTTKNGMNIRASKIITYSMTNFSLIILPNYSDGKEFSAQVYRYASLNDGDTF